MIQEGLELMVIGMGIVFAFLIAMVGAMSLNGWFFRRFEEHFPEPPDNQAPARRSGPSPEVAVAIAAAWRSRKS